MYFLLCFFDIIFFFVCGKFKGVYLVIIVNKKKIIYIFMIQKQNLVLIFDDNIVFKNIFKYVLNKMI